MEELRFKRQEDLITDREAFAAVRREARRLSQETVGIEMEKVLVAVRNCGDHVAGYLRGKRNKIYVADYSLIPTFPETMVFEVNDGLEVKDYGKPKYTRIYETRKDRRYGRYGIGRLMRDIVKFTGKMPEPVCVRSSLLIGWGLSQVLQLDHQGDETYCSICGAKEPTKIVTIDSMIIAPDLKEVPLEIHVCSKCQKYMAGLHREEGES